jgi:shikimate dehydrogenase
MFVDDVIAGQGETAPIRAARAVGCTTTDGAQTVEAVMEIMPDFLLDATAAA